MKEKLKYHTHSKDTERVLVGTFDLGRGKEMNSIVRHKLIEHCMKEHDRELAIEMVNFAYEHCPYSSFHKITDYLDELMLCQCGNIEHETNMTDTFGSINGDIGIVCLDCAKDGG